MNDQPKRQFGPTVLATVGTEISYVRPRGEITGEVIGLRFSDAVMMNVVTRERSDGVELLIATNSGKKVWTKPFKNQ